MSAIQHLIVHLETMNPIFLGLLFLALTAWAIQKKSSNAIWKGRAGQVRGASVLLLLLTFLTVGCESPETTSGCSAPMLLLLRNAPKVAKALHGAAQGSSAPLSSTPHLEFQGNRTLLAPPIDSSGNIYGVGLQRQPNCSLTEYILANYNPMTSTFAENNTVPGYQNTLHSLAQLKTQAGKFSNGCKDSPLGRSSSGAVVLGLTKDGSKYIAAGINPFNSTLLTGTVNLSTGAIAQTTVSSVPYPASVATADVNGDGNNDLIVVGLSNTSTLAGAVYVFLSNGDGTFKPPVSYASGLASDAVTIDDVNNDGKLDLVVTGYFQGQTTNGVEVLLGNGDGTFQAAIPSPVVGGYYLATGDFNGDGNKDLALSNGAILLGHGDGTFSAPAFTLPLPGGSIQAAGGLAVGDFNNDGKLDIAINQAGPSVGIFLGKGDGTFTTGKSYAGLSDASDLTVTDLDGDGNLDLIQGIGSSGQYGPSNSTHSGIVNILMGNGDGSFQGASAYVSTAAPNAFNGPVQAATFATGDFNGDGKPDILAAAVTNSGGIVSSKGLVLLAGDGKGNFTPGSAIGSSSPSVIAAADMNGDGKLDAVIADNLTSVGVAFGNGKGGFQPVVDYPLPGSANNIVDLITGDFNGDGKPDVLVTANGGSSGSGAAVYLFLNRGDGTLEPAVAIDTPASSPVGLAVGDLNGDGKLDFAMTTASISGASSSTPGSLLVYLNKGNGTFDNAVSYRPGFNPSAVAIGDMNKDGKMDVVVGSTDQNYTQGTLSVYLGKGDGSLQSPQTLTIPDAAFSSLTIADINGDSNPDVVMGQDLADVAFGNGDGTLQTPYAIGVGLVPQSVVAVDVNGDKRPDLIFVSGNSIDTLMNLYGQASTTPAATSTGLTISPNPATVGQTVTFTSQVSPASGSGAPTGTVTFLNGTNQLGTGTLNGSAKATYSTSSLAAGTYSVTASYGGDSNFAASTSSAVSLTVGTTPPPPQADFTLGASTASLSIAPGSSGTDTISVTPANGFNAAVSFACSGLPSESSCSFSPATVTPSGSTASGTTMTITTTAPTSSSRNSLPWPFAGGGITLACGLFFIGWKKRLRQPSVLSLVLLLGTVGILFGCGGGSSSKSSGGGSNGTGGTPAGTSTVTVTATSGTISHTTTISLTVQ